MKMTREGIAVVEGDEYLSRDIEVAGRLDVAREYLEQFRPLIPVGGVVLDVGACLGDMTATFSEMVGDQGRVIAIEPNPMVYECAKYNLKRFHNVVIGDVALGSKRGRARFTIDGHNIGASWITDDDGGDVEVMALDDIWHLERLDFVKIDAEGSEPEILRGALATIMKFRPVMLVEIDTRALSMRGHVSEDVFRELARLDYVFERFDGPHGNIVCMPIERTDR